MAPDDIEPTEAPEHSAGRRAVTKGVVVTLTGATALTGGGLLALGSAMTAGAQTNGGGSHGILQSDQGAHVDNAGLALANSGVNLAAGNASGNSAATQQGAGGAIPIVSTFLEGPGGPGGPGGMGGAQATQLTATASNTSGGTAAITTGAAKATGNESSTTVEQTVPAGAVATAGIAQVDQHASVSNEGLAIANSGLNLAVGNASTNSVATSQTVVGPSKATNETATASNTSSGSATITSGAATATGNSSSTSITQG